MWKKIKLDVDIESVEQKLRRNIISIDGFDKKNIFIRVNNVYINKAIDDVYYVFDYDLCKLTTIECKDFDILFNSYKGCKFVNYYADLEEKFDKTIYTYDNNEKKLIEDDSLKFSNKDAFCSFVENYSLYRGE